MLPQEGHLLRIFVAESDQYDGKPLYEWIVQKARKQGLAGCTVLRGLEGFGAKSRVHTAKILRLSADLPIVVEMVDTLEKIDAFLPIIDAAITNGLATVEKVQIRFYRGGEGD
jgi:PII-like signaling protein